MIPGPEASFILDVEVQTSRNLNRIRWTSKLMESIQFLDFPILRSDLNGPQSYDKALRCLQIRWGPRVSTDLTGLRIPHVVSVFMPAGAHAWTAKLSESYQGSDS